MTSRLTVTHVPAALRSFSWRKPPSCNPLRYLTMYDSLFSWDECFTEQSHNTFVGRFVIARTNLMLCNLTSLNVVP